MITLRLAGFVLLMILGVLPGVAGGPLGGDDLARRLDAIAVPAGGRVGVAAMVLATGETVTRDGAGRYPMQSVYKLPIAMAVLHAVDGGLLELDQRVSVGPEEYISERQHSPLRDNFPHGATLTLRELLRLAVAESDGTASDVLLRVLGGADRVMDHLQQLGILDIRVLDTEMVIGLDDAVQYLNWATPEASVVLLHALHTGRALSGESRAILLQWMTETGTGRNRLKSLLPPGASVAHKTGTSRTNAAGVTAATNDIGIVTLPEGRVVAIAVYVCDSPADQATRERVIAEIARAVIDAATAPAAPR
ncbi:MAG: class A beta-lactamase [Opitutaceae bacterium]|nr:class A beta-lactamase [Opitutaceae bacterium]